ncbi:type III effector protein [Streptomyces sp. NPDC047002]|uniref:type III effector protein n=1 Tax=Streptomyces sp. NPDC047002 TaxID=3155475 RepID=UPI003456704B
MPKAHEPTPEEPQASARAGVIPASPHAAITALRAIDRAISGAAPPAGAPGAPGASGAEEALASLLLLREVRERLAGWETGLIETARSTGASWAELAGPLGVASRQAAERRYLRGRPGDGSTTGEERVRAARDRRAADRSVTAWARENAASLRGLAGQITALQDLPAASRTSIDRLGEALGDSDPASLIGPLADARPHLGGAHPDLVARVDSVTGHTDRLRQDSDQQRHGT